MVAVTVMLDVAFHGGRAATVSAADIAERLGMARRGMEPLLQALSRGGLLESVRGPRGGYRLARERRRITLGEIVRVVRSMESAADAMEDPAGSVLGHQVVRPLWLELQEDCMTRLDNTSIEDLCLRARKAGVPTETGDRIDFSI